MAKPKGMHITPSKPKPKRRVVKVSGQPPVTLTKNNIPVAGHDPNTGVPLFRKKGVRTLQKKNAADGLSMPEARAYTKTPGVVGGPGAPSEIAKDRTPASNRSLKVIKPPRAGQGKLKRFNKIGNTKGGR